VSHEAHQKGQTVTSDHGWKVTTSLAKGHEPSAEALAAAAREPSHIVTVLFFDGDLSDGELRIEGGQDHPVGDSPEVLRAAAARLLSTADRLSRYRDER
jgi:hypothetical protein